MSDGSVVFEKRGGLLHIVLTAPRVCLICVLLTHLLVTTASHFTSADN